jgi:ADP-heptose:LPS heptosyltransferase
MLDNKFQKFLFHLTSVATTWFPRGGAWFFNTIIPPIIGNKIWIKSVFQKNLKKLKRVKQFKKILVIPDIHIGDAIMLQGAVMAFRDFFPEARIDYIIKKSVECLISGNPDISNLYPYFTGSIFPAPGDIESIRKLVVENQYDLCFNCSPFFEDTNLFPKGQPILNLLTVAPQMVRNDIEKKGINHFMTQSYEFAAKLLRDTVPSRPTKPFKGVRLTLSDKAIEEAQNFLKDKKIPMDEPVYFLNPDTASDFTRVPFEKQVELLKLLAQLPGHILFGTAFTIRGLEEKVLAKLSRAEVDKITLVPTSVTLDGYSALIDFADVFISGDTGPLHMAAARKVSKSGNFKFRNRTFIISIFGATPARSAGYDSENPLYPPANQEAVSKTYVSESTCRNITCVNKMAKTCKVVRCFEVLNVEKIANDIKEYIDLIPQKSPAFV